MTSHELIDFFLTIYVVMVVYQGNIATLFPYYCRQTFVTSVISIVLLVLGTDNNLR